MKCCASIARTVKTVSFKFGLGYSHLVSLLIDSNWRRSEVAEFTLQKNPVNQSSHNIAATSAYNMC